jgi:PAS domain S-box-containing protein
MNVEDAFDFAPCGLALLAPDGAFLRVNRALLDWTGFAASELISKKKLADLIEGDGESFFADLAQALRDAKGAIDEIFVLLRCKSGEVLPAYLNITRRGAEGGGAGTIHVAAFRGEHRASYESELRRGKQAAEQLAAIVANSIDAIVSVHPDGAVLNANRAFSDIFQYEPAELAGSKLGDLIVPEANFSEHLEKLRKAALEPLNPQIVRRHRKDGQCLDFSLSTAPIRNEDGEVVAISAIYRDIAPLMRAAEHIEFLLREVNHRSKNLLSVVQAVARQTARLADTPDLFIDGFMTRLAAIASSHDLLVSRDWRGVQIADLTRSQFSHLDEETQARIALTGDLLEINPRAAEAYGLALHELSTNAVKHGALSAPSGAVRLNFRIDPDQNFYILTWRESDGPAVTEPPRAGFGATVLTRMAPMAIEGESALDYAPEGLFYRLSAPLAQVAMNGQG